jgi:hypothetical protein
MRNGEKKNLLKKSPSPVSQRNEKKKLYKENFSKTMNKNEKLQ